MRFTSFFSIIIIAIAFAGCSKPVTKIACVGDSITEGHGLKCQSKTAYPFVLDSILGSEYQVQNCGRSATTLQRQGDFPYWIAKEFGNVFAYKPDIIIIKLGTNDTKPYNWDSKRFETEYQALIDTFKTITTKPKFYLCLPVPVYKTNWGINDSTVTAGVIPAIKNIAAKNNIEIIDLYNGLSNMPGLFPDGVHPIEEGEKIMAQIVAKSITL